MTIWARDEQWTAISATDDGYLNRASQTWFHLSCCWPYCYLHFAGEKTGAHRFLKSGGQSLTALNCDASLSQVESLRIAAQRGPPWRKPIGILGYLFARHLFPKQDGTKTPTNPSLETIRRWWGAGRSSTQERELVYTSRKDLMVGKEWALGTQTLEQYM